MVEQRLERLLAERPPRRAYDHDDDEPVEQLEEADQRPAPAEVSAGFGRWPGFTRSHLAVIGVLVLLAVLLGGWAVLRAKPMPLPVAAAPRADPAPVSASPAGSPGSSPAATAASSRASPRIVVHVLGAVRRPGLVELPSAARVQDAIEAAGGLRSTARLGDLNLAQPLTDGQQLVVGEAGDPSVLRGGSQASAGSSAGPGGSTGTGTAPGELVDLNAATVAQLDTLPGVGPVTAAKIVAWREEHGRFTRVEELQEVSGVGPKTYAEIAPLCRV